MPEAVVPEPLDADAAASREFSKVRRGYDPVEVYHPNGVIELSPLNFTS